jgi:hypothetical protein
MLHAHVVQGYERYIGLLGRARELIERFDAWFNLREHAAVGSAAFEARLEIQKLPAAIEDRMARLSQRGLDPAAQVRLLDEVNSLARQIDAHRTRLNDFTEGRGYVAAEGLALSRPSEDSEIAAQRERYQERDAVQLRLDTAELTARRQEALAERTAAEDALVAAQEQLGPVQRQRDRMAGRVERAQEELGVAQRQRDRGKPSPEAAQLRLETAQADLRQRQQELAAADQALTDLQTTLRTETQRLAMANEAFTATSAELTGALEARQARLNEDARTLQREAAEVEAAMLSDIQDLPAIPETAAEVELRGRIEDMEIALEALQEAGTDVPQQRRLQRQIDAAEAELRGKRADRVRQQEAQVNAIRRAAGERLGQLQREIAALNAELQPVLRQTLELRRSGDWTVQTYHDLGSETVAPCFTGKTLVKTPQGDRAIADLRVGDVVLGFDIEAQSTVTSRVIRVWRNWTDRLVIVGVGDEVILATGGHPFWRDDACAWVPARELHRGAQLRTTNAGMLTVREIGAQLGTSPTFNLETETTHTYFVGRQGVLVHNRSTPPASNPNSRFLNPRLRSTTIYVIWDVRTTPRVPLYVGKTYQSTDGTARFEQHLAEGNDEIEAGRKRQWAEMHARGELVMEPVRTGAWTEFETAVWEQHFIRQYNGGEDIKPGENRLQNRRNEITPETYRAYKNQEILMPDGTTFRHNPCR